jgi:lipoprotein-releasing system permease protein
LNFLFAWRYFRAKKSANAINIIAWISMLAMLFGTTALILVLSVFNGFEGLVKSLYSSFYTDLKIFPVQGKVLTLTADQLQQIRGLNGIKNFSLIAEEKALLQNGDYQSIVNLKGVDENYEYVSGVAGAVVKGEFELGDEENPSLVLGAGIENAVGVQTDRNLLPLIIHVPKKSETEILDPLQNISTDTITTAGAFILQQDFDNKYGITNLAFVKNMLAMRPDEYNAVEIALTNSGDVSGVQDKLKQLLGNNYKVLTRYEQNRSLYSIMQAEKWVIYAVLALIMGIFSFTMISSLTMLVLEKQKDISVLHALGANRNFIQRVFLSEGLLLAGIGAVAGILLALLIVWLQLTYKLIPLQGGSFLIDYFPVKLRLPDFLLVAVTVLIIALLASWIPARKAAGQEFSLRSE